MPASTMLSGVAKSGSPISRWTIFLPSASSRRALARTTNAPSVPRRDMRSAKRISTPGIVELVDADERAAVDAERLTGDESGLARAQKGARSGELGWIAIPPHRRLSCLALEPLFHVTAGSRSDVASPVGKDVVGRKTVHRYGVPAQLAGQ